MRTDDSEATNRRHRDLQAIIDRGGCLDHLSTIAGCIVSHDLSLDMHINTLRSRLVALPYIADIEPDIFQMVVQFLRQREQRRMA